MELMSYFGVDMPAPFEEKDFLSDDDDQSDYSLNSSLSGSSEERDQLDEMAPNSYRPRSAAATTPIRTPRRLLGNMRESPGSLATGTPQQRGSLAAATPKIDKGNNVVSPVRKLMRTGSALSIMNDSTSYTSPCKRRLQQQVEIPTNKDIVQAISTFYGCKPRFYKEEINYGSVKTPTNSLHQSGSRLLIHQNWNKWSESIVSKFTHRAPLAIDLINQLKLFLMNQEKTMERDKLLKSIEEKLKNERDEKMKLQKIKGALLVSGTTTKKQKKGEKKRKGSFQKGVIGAKKILAATIISSSARGSPTGISTRSPRGGSTRPHKGSFSNVMPGLAKGASRIDSSTSLVSYRGNTGLYYGQSEVMGHKVYHLVKNKMQESNFEGKDLRGARSFLLRHSAQNLPEGEERGSNQVNIMNVLVDSIYDKGLLGEWKKAESERGWEEDGECGEWDDRGGGGQGELGDQEEMHDLREKGVLVYGYGRKSITPKSTFRTHNNK